jgi:hypothetical protein
MSIRQANVARSSAPGGPLSSQTIAQIFTWPALAAGLVGGILIGLLFGWLIWPVQWVNAWPGDLAPEARAHYLATVAEAYSYYDDDRSAEIARVRLFDLNENLAEEIAAAQSYFNDSAYRDSAIYITQLGRLAQALDVQSPDIIINGASPAATPPAVVGPSLLDWLNWLFVVVAALVLIVGGVYIVYERSKRRQARESDVVYNEDEDVGGFEEDDWDSDYDERAIYQRPVSRATVGTPSGAPPEGEVYFDAAEDDDPAFDDGSFDDDASFAQPRTNYVDDYADDERPQPPIAPSALPVVAATATPSNEPIAKDEVLGTYTVHYLAGLLDYDETYHINDPATGRAIGECGMGVNMKNGYLQSNPEHVIALDVFLFDKKDANRIHSQNRILLCEYVVNHKLEHAFSKERPNDPSPLVAQPDVEFQLEGTNLVMDCEILDVDYLSEGDAAGIFQNLKLRLTVRNKVE